MEIKFNKINNKKQLGKSPGWDCLTLYFPAASMTNIPVMFYRYRSYGMQALWMHNAYQLRYPELSIALDGLFRYYRFITGTSIPEMHCAASSGDRNPTQVQTERMVDQVVLVDCTLLYTTARLLGQLGPWADIKDAGKGFYFWAWKMLCILLLFFSSFTNFPKSEFTKIQKNWYQKNNSLVFAITRD